MVLTWSDSSHAALDGKLSLVPIPFTATTAPPDVKVSSGLAKLKTMWGAALPCPGYVVDAIDVAEAVMFAEGIEYVTTDRPQVYDGAMYNLSGPWAWEHEASAQHERFFYMYMSGISLPVIRKGLGPMWSPPPGDGGCG